MPEVGLVVENYPQVNVSGHEVATSQINTCKSIVANRLREREREVIYTH